MMISYKEACEIIFESAKGRKLEIETLPLNRISERICAQDVFAPIDIQPFDNSAMDGFAVYRDDLARATQDNPVTLEKSGVIAAGDLVSHTSFQRGSCVQIMTGAPMPSGADAVVPVELVKIGEDGIAFFSTPEIGAHIRHAGEDFKTGDVLLKVGDPLDAAYILPLATLGISSIEVFKKPRVAFLSTGKELVDDLSTSLGSGQIYNSNRPYALAFLNDLGVECFESLTIQDEPEDFKKHLSALVDQNPDMIISSGAVSAGAFDFVKSGLENLGAEILYHKVKIKPGKPNLLARLPNGTLYFGLPGNPVATAVGLRFFVDIAFRAMSGMEMEEPLHVKLEHPYSKKSELQMFLKGRLTCLEDGSFTVSILEGQDSFMVNPFLKMNAWVCVPDKITEIKDGEIVDVYPLYPRGGLM
ncbi:MAG: molybdopterin molybdotransferase MoeA [Alphaproteobacteria bacterium]|nr:molybdopterin molybdotransferase MoeA [Alphaproteobacteria bacterium]MCB9984700.1 molybdopterin molybdotransferase MoeA [Micavibrio sp.]HPQ50150.1 molybdopterin molybdotransferase MoeA [Alphaproteobacteria bacterium]HRK98367.1 molybdopterin molybdotransferase MoeA [Alphaproteobacteria bacterium]